MGLNWNTQQCPRWEELTPQERQEAIFMTMSAGIGKVTKENVTEFAARVRVLGMDNWSCERLMLLVGLSTNVSFESRLTWLVSRFTNRINDARRDATRAYVEVYGEPVAAGTQQEGLGYSPAALSAATQHDLVEGVLDALVRDAALSIGLPDLPDYTNGIDYVVVDAVSRAVREVLVGAARERIETMAEEAAAEADAVSGAA